MIAIHRRRIARPVSAALALTVASVIAAGCGSSGMGQPATFARQEPGSAESRVGDGAHRVIDGTGAVAMAVDAGVGRFEVAHFVVDDGRGITDARGARGFFVAGCGRAGNEPGAEFGKQ